MLLKIKVLHSSEIYFKFNYIPLYKECNILALDLFQVFCHKSIKKSNLFDK